MTAFRIALKKISPEQLFMASVMLVNMGNYGYNLVLGRLLGPAAFAEAALLVTLLLALSFMGMTFQLACAKFAVLFEGSKWASFRKKMLQQAGLTGVVVGLLLLLFSDWLRSVFNTESSWMFVIFAIGVPCYFLMSVNRGAFQGKQQFTKLSITYQTEMWARLGITLALLYLIPWQTGIIVALGILLSFVFGLFPWRSSENSPGTVKALGYIDSKRVTRFMLLTAGYELTQIIINNSDVLLVKHYFEATDAGLYASLALIGRAVYFAAWMFVMLLLPQVVQKQKEGMATAPILFRYVCYIGFLSLGIVLTCYLFPELIIKLLFGDAYIAMAPLLWQYALATSLFAISNIFAYYFLSLDHYTPVVLSGVLGLSQIVLVVLFHSSLQLVVQVQIIAMIALLVTQLLYFITNKEMTRATLKP